MKKIIRKEKIEIFKTLLKEKRNFKINNMKVNLSLTKTEFNMWINYLKTSPVININC